MPDADRIRRQLARFWGSVRGLAARLLDESDLTREHIERIALGVLEAGGTQEEVAQSIEAALEAPPKPSRKRKAPTKRRTRRSPSAAASAKQS